MLQKGRKIDITEMLYLYKYIIKRHYIQKINNINALRKLNYQVKNNKNKL